MQKKARSKESGYFLRFFWRYKNNEFPEVPYLNGNLDLINTNKKMTVKNKISISFKIRKDHQRNVWNVRIKGGNFIFAIKSWEKTKFWSYILNVAYARELWTSYCGYDYLFDAVIDINSDFDEIHQQTLLNIWSIINFETSFWKERIKRFHRIVSSRI